MSEVKISALPASGAINATDKIPGNNAGVTSAMTPAQLATFMETNLNLVTLVAGNISLAANGSFSFFLGGTFSHGNVTISTSSGVLTWGGAAGTLGTGGSVSAANGLTLLNSDASISFCSGSFVLNADGTTVLTVSTPSAGTSYTIDLTKPSQTITTASQIDFTATSNKSANGNRTAYVRVAANAGGARALSFNASWVFLGVGAPTTIAANKVGILSLTSFGNAETDIVAAWAVQP